MAGVTALAALLAACGRPRPPEPPGPVAPPQTSAPAPGAVPVAQVAAAPVPPPQSMTQSPPAARASAPAAAGEPELSAMRVAAAVSSKIGVPVDLRYQFDGDALSGQPVTLHLAAVPRVEGGNLAVSIKQEPGIEAVSEVLGAQKVSADAAYRRQLSVRRSADGPAELRVLVTMDLPMGSAFSYFSVPLGPAPPAGKQPAERRHE